METDNHISEAIDTVSFFLAKRDLSELSQAVLMREGHGQFDVLLALGCDLTEVVERAVAAFRDGLVKVVVFSGGIGHGTQYLRDNVRRKYGLKTDDLPEAEIMAMLAMNLGMARENFLVENTSTNGGENIRFSLQLLDKLNYVANSILLIQDPFMQLRSHYTVLRAVSRRKNAVVRSFAPFIPTARDMLSESHWTKARFFELLLREIPRLRDAPGGYGPQGMDFFDHVDIPANVGKSYTLVKNYCLATSG